MKAYHDAVSSVMTERTLQLSQEDSGRVKGTGLKSAQLSLPVE